MTTPAHEDHVLIIPVNGLIEVFHVDGPVNINLTLHERGGHGSHIALHLQIDHEPRGTIHWYSNTAGPTNPRAREAMVMASGVHMIFTGPVAFTGLDPLKVGEIVSALSRKE